VALAAVEALERRGCKLIVAPQCLTEFWVAATRPKGEPSNGLGMSPQEARDFLAEFLSLYAFVEDTPAVFSEWFRLVQAFGVSGKPAHDARLVAVMRVHGIGRMLTFNTRHFRRYEGMGLTFLHPNDVAAGAELSVEDPNQH
jgi:hypothetical protein